MVLLSVSFSRTPNRSYLENQKRFRRSHLAHVSVGGNADHSLFEVMSDQSTRNG